MEKYIDIIFFAIVAAILLYRLKDVLGEKTGFQGKEPSSTGGNSSRETDESPLYSTLAEKAPDYEEPTDKQLKKTLDKIRSLDSSFSQEHFIAGASQAFRMTLKAFANGDKDLIKQLSSREVAKTFNAVIDARRRAKQVLESSLERILSAEILQASLERKVATVQVKFVSERTDVLYDKKGSVIEGDPDTISESIDIWTFERKVTDANPNWILVSTSTEKNK